MGKIEEKRERWYRAEWGKVELTADNEVHFSFAVDDSLTFPLGEWHGIVKFIGAEIRRKTREEAK